MFIKFKLIKMNFEFIFDNYPKSFVKLQEWCYKNRSIIEEQPVLKFTKSPILLYYLPSGYRWLYDFFEHHSMFLILEMTNNNSFYPYILVPKTIGQENILEQKYRTFASRSHAEEIIFPEMFKILESKLNEL